ncbi:MAG: DUF11 domain-containing protein [Notoacmeibacter sp.]|nr:DUF11 domain-containing protein [Notoacmeibacter sp.]
MAVIAFAAGTTVPAFADITNDATANGTYNSTGVASNTDSVAVTVTTAAPDLAITKSAAAPDVTGGADNAHADAGDTITYTYTVTNNGNVSMSNVTPIDTGPTFDGEPGTGTLGGFTLTTGALPLAPGATLTYTAVYTMSAADVFNAAGVTDAVSNVATVSGETPAGMPFTDPDPSNTATTTIDAFPALNIVKASSTAGPVNVGDTITYTYTVTNTGNVAITDVSITDTHEGVAITAGLIASESLTSDGPLASQTNAITSSDATASDGTWSLLQPGAVVTFTYVHTVTQAEFDAQ